MLTDYLIIGSGIAGLTYALKVSEDLPDASITIITKSDANEGSTKYAQGGIAVVLDSINDSFEEHVNDTLKAGDGLSDKKIVRMVVKDAPNRFKDLLRYGIDFDKNDFMKYDLALEGGHTNKRILHHKDSTGIEIEKKLLKNINTRSNISLYTHLFAIDLIVQENICLGTIFFNVNSGKVDNIISKFTLLATGGIGQIYKHTTNPIVSTGDGIAMAYRANAEIDGMEFVQFHPTALYNPTVRPLFLVSEAVRGMSANLKSINGNSFMSKYHKDKDLATRDIVSRAIYKEIKKSEYDYLFLDCSAITKSQFKRKFPSIFKECESLGLNIPIDNIPITTAAHFICGGIVTNHHGETSVKNLYACGECANTGLHGANRLASNSLLESLVFAHRCALDSVIKYSKVDFNKSTKKIKNYNIKSYSKKSINQDLLEIREIMTNNIGVFTDYNKLKNAMDFMKKKSNKLTYISTTCCFSVELFELKNILQVAILVIQSSMVRTENKGVFFNNDLIN